MTMPTAPYFAPAFFSPFYFPPLAVNGGGTPGFGPYFAPTFFSPFYFPSLVASEETPGVGIPPGPGFDAFSWIAQSLGASGAFADVFFGTVPKGELVGADCLPAAIITPNDWTDLDETDPTLIVREVSFTLTIIVRDEEPSARYQSLERLTRVARRVIHGSDLGGVALPPLTRLGRGRLDGDPRHPDQSVTLYGEFAYLTEPGTGPYTG
jgi:hypothetical protein